MDNSTVTHRGKPKKNGAQKRENQSASMLEWDPSVWMFSYGVEDGAVTRKLRERVRELAKIVPVTLDPNGSIHDHVCTLEHRLYEHFCEGSLKERVFNLEMELEVLDDLADFNYLTEGDKMFNPFPLAPDNIRDSAHVRHPKRPKKIGETNEAPAWYNILQKLYLLCAFIFFVGPLQGLMIEMLQVFGSSVRDICQVVVSAHWDILQVFGSSTITLFSHVRQHWGSVYAPLLAPIFWIIAGYLACAMSRPRPITTYEIASTYIPRHLRRNTKGMRRKKRKEERKFCQSCTSSAHVHKNCPHSLKRQGLKGKDTSYKNSGTTAGNTIDLSGMGEYFKRHPIKRSKSHKRQNSLPVLPKKRKAHLRRHSRQKPSNFLGSDNFRHPDVPRFYSAGESLGRQTYNEHLVNIMSPADISGFSKHKALKAALHAPQRFREAMGKSDQFPIIWDSGASVCVTFDKSDFLSFNKTTQHKPMKSISGNHNVCGEGYVLWSIQDEAGVLRNLKLKALWVPDCTVRLLSTESLLQQYPDESIELLPGSLRLSGVKNDKCRNPVTVRIHPSTNLPTSVAYRYNGCVSAAKALHNIVSVVNSANTNLTEAEKELLRWHQRLGHISFKRVQSLFRSGVLSHSEATRRLHTAASKLPHPPKCAACQYGKQTCRPAKGKVTSVVRDRQGVLRQDNLLPGQCISVDHFVCSTRGRLYASRGKTSALEKLYCGGCLFVDHASGFVHVEHQTSLSSHDTLRAKETFELFCRDHGVLPQKYMSDNATAFTAKSFADHLREYFQIISFAGVGAHHHNGHAERSIRTIMSIARTMMLHTAVHWPDLADPTLWPMAVDHAVYLWNHLPSDTTGLSPSDLFTKTRWPQQRFHDLHVWGCPVYVLEKLFLMGKRFRNGNPDPHA